eukprot:1394788-Amorphochlora_amoeboformis.AAC.1
MTLEHKFGGFGVINIIKLAILQFISATDMIRQMKANVESMDQTLGDRARRKSGLDGEPGGS